MSSGSSQRAICYHGNGDHIILKHLLASRGDISSLANVLVNVSEQIGKKHLIKKKLIGSQRVNKLSLVIYSLSFE